MSNNEPLSIGPGKAVYPRLATPDTKFDELGAYKADVSMPKVEAEPIMKQLKAVYKAHTGKAPDATNNPMWSVETDEEGEPTGNIVFKCRVKNKLRKSDGKVWDRKPKMFDAALKPVSVNPYGGSTYIVSVEVYEWTAGAKKGVSLQPIGVQVLDLISGSGPSASSMGFKAQEGYTGSPVDDDEDEDEDDQSAGADDGDDDDDDGDY